MISIIIPAYNNLALCQQAVRSVLMQENCLFEVIITDDSTSNRIEQWISSLDDIRIIYIHNNPSKGAVANWNYGLSLATGEYIILLHHDEFFRDSTYLNRVNDELKDNDVVIHNKSVLIGNKEKKDRIPEWVKRFVLWAKTPIFAVNVIGPCSCVAFHKELLEQLDTRLQWKVDIEWYYRMLKKAKHVKYNDSRDIVSVHGHAGQITNNIEISQVNKVDTEIILSKYNSFCICFWIFVGKMIKAIK